MKTPIATVALVEALVHAETTMALSQISLLDQVADPEEAFTLKLAILLNVAGGLTRTIAAMLAKDVLPPNPSIEQAGKVLKKISPELQLYAALWVHFHEQKRTANPQDEAKKVLAILGHEIPEELIRGIE